MYYARKIVSGDDSNHCYQQIEVGLNFDKKRNLIERQIESGGDFEATSSNQRVSSTTKVSRARSRCMTPVLADSSITSR